MHQNRNRQEFFKYHHIIIFSRPLAIAQKSLVYIMNVRVSICGNKVVSYLPLYIKWHSHWSILIFKDMQNILILVSRLRNTYPIPEFWQGLFLHFIKNHSIMIFQSEACWKEIFKEMSSSILPWTHIVVNFPNKLPISL